MACTYDTTNTTDERSGATSISALHTDIIQTHILTCLDGPALASAGSTCSQLHALSSHEPLWENVCRSTWPSTNAPRLRHVISTFPRASHSFFSDSFPSFSPSGSCHASTECAPELISAVDLFLRRRAVFSRMVEMETESDWFRCSPFRLDLLDPKDAVATAMECPMSEEECQRLGEELTLSWIVVDPKAKRAVNVSSFKAVSVERHWLSREVRLRFATVVDGGEKGTVTEAVLCSVTVTCGREMQVREVCLQMENLDGMHLNGRDSLGILQRALEGKRGKLIRDENEGRNRYLDFEKRKEARKEKKLRDERRLDVLCVALTVLSFAAFPTLYFLL